MDNGCHILGGLNLIQLPLQFFIVNTIEILSPKYFLNIVLPLLSRIINLLTEHLVFLTLLYICHPVQEFIPAS